ncbi:isochorismate synthase [Metabacillus arenae]|uniref:Isochorismate synthase MenF n=1 Tax=Metabacillus arenae TaxID=2771434 RepID=A0A926RXL6_9BACI|nr:isochorismate synthase [Metabacillus arenae]MBD1380267.1 isochorismate synthase [Metabacillus arenae]
MVTTLQDTFKQNILNALEQAKKKNKSVLVSHVEKIQPIDPLQFYSQGEEAFLGERFFWKAPGHNLTIVGLGKEDKISTDDHTNNRFHYIENIWKQLKESYINNINLDRSHQATGPILFGGFSFDPLKEKDQKWDTFSEANLMLPKLMYTLEEGNGFLTINQLVYPNDSFSHCIKHYDELKNYASVSGHFSCGFQEIEYRMEEKNTREWLDAIKQATKQIRRGEFNKVVLAREVSLSFNKTVDIYRVLASLIEEQTSSYIFSFEKGRQCFVGATPERLVKKEKDQLLSTCLAGSIKRGQTVKEDEQLGLELLNDPKNLEEHAFVVKMISDAVSDCCETLDVPKEPALLKTKNIQHLYTPVKGKMKPGFSLWDLIEKLHPTPALGGYPKEKAIEKIRELEPMHRGWYAGPIGWIDANDNGEFAVALRSGLIEDDQVSLYAGCGIVKDSVPEREYYETQIKLNPMLSALGGTIHE